MLYSHSLYIAHKNPRQKNIFTPDDRRSSSSVIHSNQLIMSKSLYRVLFPFSRLIFVKLRDLCPGVAPTDGKSAKPVYRSLSYTIRPRVLIIITVHNECPSPVETIRNIHYYNRKSNARAQSHTYTVGTYSVGNCLVV